MPTLGASSRFDVLLAAYLDAARSRHLSAVHRRSHHDALVRFRQFLLKKHVVDVRSVSADHVVAWVSSLQRHVTVRNGPYSTWSLKRLLGAIHAFFRFLVARDVLLKDPAADVRLRVRRGLPRGILTEAQARRLMETPAADTTVGLRDRAILELLYGTGLRLAECARLDLVDLDLAGETLVVRSGKGRKDRVVPLPRQAADAVVTYLRLARPELARSARESGLFLSTRRSGVRLGMAGIQAVVVHHSRAAGIPGRRGPHVLRHTCATHLLKHGADVRHVQKILGHADIKATAIYTRVEIGDLRRMLARAHPRERRRGPSSLK